MGVRGSGDTGAMETEVRIGASLSLTGRYALQGRQAESGLRLWVADANAERGLLVGGARRPARLVIHDDDGRADRLEANLARLLDQDGVDVLFGPYGSDLALRAVRLAAARGRILWNHAGASDAVPAAAPQAVVSGIALASAYFEALPDFFRRTDPAFDRIAILHASPGTFGAFVASGAAAAAHGAGLEAVSTFPFPPPLADRHKVLADVRAWRPRAVICAGRFEDDVWLAGHREVLGPTVAALAAVGAGLAAFGVAVGPAAEGVVGPSHWEPCGEAGEEGGGEEGGFAAGYRRANGILPEYPAALAYAMGTVLGACAARVGSLDDAALRRAALEIETVTPIGRFRLDPATGRQAGYRPVLVRWHRGAKRICLSPGPEIRS